MKKTPTMRMESSVKEYKTFFKGLSRSNASTPSRVKCNSDLNEEKDMGTLKRCPEPRAFSWRFDLHVLRGRRLNMFSYKKNNKYNNN